LANFRQLLVEGESIPQGLKPSSDFEAFTARDPEGSPSRALTQQGAFDELIRNQQVVPDATGPSIEFFRNQHNPWF